MGILKEFKQFAIKGNVLDLAVAVVIGAAFGKIISSLVEDIITPAILNPALEAANLKDLNQLVIPGTAIKYGNFLSQVISFLIISFSVFLIVKAINSLKKKEVENPIIDPLPTKQETLLIEIRDILKQRGQNV